MLKEPKTITTAQQRSTPFLDTLLASEYLGISKPSLERMRCQGTGPRFRKHGRRVLYLKADLDAWSEARAATSVSEASFLDLQPPAGW